VRIEIRDVAGENCVTLAEGQKLYELIHPELEKALPVELDFNGCQVFASPFFNAAIGQLLRDQPPDRLNSLLRFQHLSPSGHRLLSRVIDNSKQYYSNEALRSATDQAILGESDEAEV